ncbi:major intrinsic protein domain-containing protein [Trichoderma breve]|uniref:Major intrinsic protein domain-containing protein n=1 Tax=Trichoderma breve TaxID=2034170 RepID=A0A9W9E9U8_9HYPO|nr:major intrinsic protein domain-containing protein [Trichoderma breve]KAJ4860631.1 major intrinsic protein domain-containing protein [Trichoderma breve]
MSHIEHIHGVEDDLKNRQEKLSLSQDDVSKDHHVTMNIIVSEEHTTAWFKFRKVMREPFSEFFGVMILVLFGDGSVAQVVLGKGSKGDWNNINWGWALGVMLGVYCGGVSGAHLNPAVTLANCIFRKFPWKKLPVYALAQLLGAMAASIIVYGNYKSAIDVFEGGQGMRTVGLDTSTAGIFCTYPAPFLTKTGQFFDEFIGSSILMFCLYALLDEGNIGAGNLTPLGLFFVIYGIGACFGSNTGYAINPARDLGPRIMSHAVGYGHQVWTAGDYYFWVPVIAPFLGCTFGGFLYDTFIYTGDSPINAPYMGFTRFMGVRAKARRPTMV